MNKNTDLLYAFTDEFMNSLFLKTEKIRIHEPLPEQFDFGLRSMLGIRTPLTISDFTGISFDDTNKSIYYLQDEYSCSYILLPHDSEDLIILIGPYITEVPEIGDIRKMFRRQRVTNEQVISLLQYYGSLPCITDEGILYSYIEVLSHFVQGDEADIRKLNTAVTDPEFTPAVKQDPVKRMQTLEKKYQTEAALMERIAAGDEAGALKAFTRIGRLAFDNRSTDTIRSTQYYLSVLNTLCRKAAQRGNVHPYFLDEISRQMSVRILKTYDLKKLDHLADEMITDYCRLTSRHKVTGYSRTISDAVNYIYACIDQQDLSLDLVADELNVSKSYLSARFREETGMTMTAYIAKIRMDSAQELLKSTALPIQDIASLSGYDDAAYFTRLFKKKTGMSPREYRKKPEKKSSEQR